MRLIRNIPAGGVQAPRSSIDDITDPQMLTHSILDLKGERTEVQYPPYLRVSMLHDVCVRERALGYHSKAFFKKAVNANLHLTFALGHAIHNYLQNTNDYFGDKRFGWWECLACGHKYFGRFPKHDCHDCKAPKRAIQYVEHSIKMEDPFRTTGHIDSFMEVEPSSIRVVDFKTINGEDFEKLKGPLGSHVIQVSAYMMLMEHDKTLPVKIDPNRGMVIYVSKKHTVKSLPIKVFHVQRNAVTDRYIIQTLQTFTDAILDESLIPPKHPQCVQTQHGCYRSKACPLKEECLAAG